MPAGARCRARRAARGRTAGRPGRSRSRRTSSTPRADDRLGQQQPVGDRVELDPVRRARQPRLSGAEPGRTDGAAARSIRAIDAARRSRASTLVSSLQRHESSGEHGAGRSRTSSAIDRRSELSRERAARGRARDAAASANASAATRGRRSAERPERARGAARRARARRAVRPTRAGRGSSIGWPGPNSETWLRVTMRTR